jgi:hypothetical protein
MLFQKERLLKFEISLLSNSSKRPALIVLCAGRITVDAREKD